MAYSQLVNVGSAQLLNTQCSIVGIWNALDTAAVVELPIRFTGYINQLYVYASVAPTSFTVSLGVMHNQVATSLNVSYSVGQSGIKQRTNVTVTVTATSTLNYYGSTSAESNFRVNLCGVRFIPTAPATRILTIMAARSSAGVNVTVGQTFYCAANGELLATTTEAQTKFSVSRAMTAGNLYTYVSTGGAMATLTCRTRINGANGAGVTTYTAGQSGAKEDTTNTDAIAIGEDLNYSIAGTGMAGTFTIKTLCIQLYKNPSTTATQFYSLMTSSTDGVGVAFNTTTYCGCAGDLIFNTTELQVQVKPRFSMDVRNIGAYVSANTIATSVSTIYVRNNEVDSEVLVSYNAGQTGLKTDSTLSTLIPSGSGVNYKVVTPNTSGTLTITWISLFAKQERLADRVLVYQAVQRAVAY